MNNVSTLAPRGMNKLIPLDHPVLRTPKHAAHLSGHYVHINTGEVIDALFAEGFTVHEARADGSRRRDPRFVRHQIDLRLPGAPLVDGNAPRILFTNSHNGTRAASVALGVFRLVCSNGLVVGSIWAQERARHAGESARTLIDRVQALAKNTAPLFDQIQRWTRTPLTVSRQIDFAKAAAELRYGDAQRFDPQLLLGHRRGEDEGDDLWRVFNRVQENAVRGGLIGATAAGRQVTSRPLDSIGAGTSFNAQLWALAEQFA